MWQISKSLVVKEKYYWSAAFFAGRAAERGGSSAAESATERGARGSARPFEAQGDGCTALQDDHQVQGGKHSPSAGQTFEQRLSSSYVHQRTYMKFCTEFELDSSLGVTISACQTC